MLRPEALEEEEVGSEPRPKEEGAGQSLVLSRPCRTQGVRNICPGYCPDDASNQQRNRTQPLTATSDRLCI